MFVLFLFIMLVSKQPILRKYFFHHFLYLFSFESIIFTCANRIHCFFLRIADETIASANKFAIRLFFFDSDNFLFFTIR